MSVTLNSSIAATLRIDELMMASWSLEVGMWQVIWAGFVLGVGFGMSFSILSAAGLSRVERSRMGYAASLFGMMQQQRARMRPDRLVPANGGASD